MTIDDLIWIGVGLLVGAASILLIQGKKGPGYALLAAAAALVGIQIGRASKGSSTQQDDPREPTGLDADTEPGLVTEIKHTQEAIDAISDATPDDDPSITPERRASAERGAAEAIRFDDASKAERERIDKELEAELRDILDD